MHLQDIQYLIEQTRQIWQQANPAQIIHDALELQRTRMKSNPPTDDEHEKVCGIVVQRIVGDSHSKSMFEEDLRISVSTKYPAVLREIRTPHEEERPMLARYKDSRAFVGRGVCPDSGREIGDWQSQQARVKCMGR